jgi:hypothetical protein
MDHKKILWVCSLTLVSGIQDALDKKIESKYTKLMKSDIEEANDEFWEVVCPDKSSLSRSQIKDMNLFTNCFLNIHGRDRFVECINSLRMNRSVIGDMINKDFLEYMQLAPENKSGRGYSKYNILIDRFGFFWRQNSYFAYRLANAIAITRWAGVENIATKKEVLMILEDIADLIIKEYPSYEVFGRNAMLSHEIIKEKPEFKEIRRGVRTEEVKMEIVYHGFWSQIGWGGM